MNVSEFMTLRIIKKLVSALEWPTNVVFKQPLTTGHRQFEASLHYVVSSSYEDC